MEKVYTVKDIANMLQVKETTVTYWIRKGKLTATRLADSRLYRVKESDLNKFLENKEVE